MLQSHLQLPVQSHRNLMQMFLFMAVLNKAGSIIRVNAQLIDSKTEEVFKSFQIEGTAEEYIFISLIHFQ